MTRRQLARRVEYWRARILPEWRVSLMHTPPPGASDDDYAGTVQVEAEIAEARVRIPDATLEHEPAAIDRVIVHELLHPLADQLHDAADPLEEQVASAVWEMFAAQRTLLEEQMIDRLARVVVAIDAGHAPSDVYFTGPGRDHVDNL